MTNTNKAPIVPSGNLSLVLGQIPAGIERPATAAQISRITGIDKRTVYSAIETLIMQYSIPIGGVRQDHRHGVFIITNEDERRQALAPLDSNARKIQRRVAKLRTMTLKPRAEVEP